MAMRPLRRLRVWTAAQRAVCCGVSTLGGGRGWWTGKEGVSGPDGSEEGRWGDIIKTQEMRNPKIIRKRAKSRKCRKDQSSKRKIQNRILATTQTGRRQSRKRRASLWYR